MNLMFFNTVALGDYLVHSRLIKDFKLKYNCHVTAVCSPYNSRIVKFHEHIDEIILYDEKWPISKKLNILRRILKKNTIYQLSLIVKNFQCLVIFYLNQSINEAS